MKKAPGAYGRPRTTLNRDIDVEDVRMAKRQADSGRFFGMSKICRSLLAQTRLQVALTYRTGALMACDMTAEHPSDVVTDALTGVAGGWGGDWWHILPEEELHAIMSVGLIAGMALCELDWQYKPETGRWVPILLLWDLEHLRWDPITREYSVTVLVGGQRQQVPLDPLKWFLFTPYGGEKPWERGVWAGLSEDWLLADYARQDIGGYSEVHGNPGRIGKVPPGTRDAEKHKFLADIEDMRSTGAIVLEDQTYALEILEAKARTWDVMRYLLDRWAEEAGVAILQGNLLQQVKGGSYSAAEVHKSLFESGITPRDAETMSTQLAQGPLGGWLLMNFEAAGDVYLRFNQRKKRAEQQRETLAAMAEYAKTVKALRDAGIEVDVAALAEMLALEVPLK